jgi:MoaA/NifB/PqqE/SkfB family radical SAM enzyme
MPFNTLALMLGYRCNAKCRCCLWGELHSCGPNIDVAQACSWVDQACAIADLKLIGFSGGESFLYSKEMALIAAHAQREHGLVAAASTNSYWAYSRQRAIERLEPLYKVGLRQLLLSVDDFHQEYVPLARVKNALRAAKELGIGCTLQSIVTKSSRRIADFMKELNVQEGDGLQATEVFCTRIGWAATKVPEAEFPPQENALSSYCSMLQPLVIGPDGAVYLCCGAAFAAPGLKVGNLTEEPLADILQRAEWDPMLNALALGNGPAYLADCLRASGKGDVLRASGYSSSCEACHDILAVSGIKNLLSEKLEPHRAELFLKRMMLTQEKSEHLLEALRI